MKPLRVFVAFAMAAGLVSVGLTAPASATTGEAPCFKYAWNSYSNYAGSEYAFIEVSIYGYWDMRAETYTANGTYTGVCGNHVNGWTQEALAAGYYKSGGTYYGCPGAYNYVSSTVKDGISVNSSGCQNYTDYSAYHSHRVWFAGAARDSNGFVYAHT